jgi:hypothetical protein
MFSMTAGADRVVARYKRASADSLWADAKKDIGKLGTLLKKAKKQEDPKIATAVGKLKGLTRWLVSAFDEAEIASSVDVWQLIARSGPAETLRLLTQFVDAVQVLLNSTASATFSYSGFAVENPQNLGEAKCLRALSGIDYLQAMFEKRGVSKLLKSGLTGILLTSEGVPLPTVAGMYYPRIRTIALFIPTASYPLSKSHFLDWFNHVFLHEFGHYVHMAFLPGEAVAAWDSAWGGLEEEESPEELPASVSNYGRSNKFEDFAETFVAFMAAPEKLTPEADFRMKRTLSLSGLYGKPVMRLAKLDAP